MRGEPGQEPQQGRRDQLIVRAVERQPLAVPTPLVLDYTDFTITGEMTSLEMKIIPSTRRSSSMWT